jgi:hypothetical protein
MSQIAEPIVLFLCPNHALTLIGGARSLAGGPATVPLPVHAPGQGARQTNALAGISVPKGLVWFAGEPAASGLPAGRSGQPNRGLALNAPPRICESTPHSRQRGTPFDKV